MKSPRVKTSYEKFSFVPIVVTNKSDWDRRAAEMSSDKNDHLVMLLLTGEANSGKNSLTFESDFTMPDLPKIE